ncbi:MAG: hypothetical protein ACLU4N_19965 [Butyricimonas faecihominis]
MLTPGQGKGDRIGCDLRNPRLNEYFKRKPEGLSITAGMVDDPDAGREGKR